ncbi:sigma-70 family RNA polymerase sigma factor [Asticcacaulis machinosus]|uniref:Sigma-70 family RNA polymerase sigma factor n=1 Tax=Asticcacaulis machinosus TaxID=2984211 RepID=A0ABT5HGZ4_9CAUL|nr:sigma-70 family RNA polymerase sigma factor [Asticcacaulis machinosus]MDC7675530.1 sigma-70 family RNA polymerase sigma factor [Asticcacaulis machinosus]
MLTEPQSLDIHVGMKLRARRLELQMSEEWLASMFEQPLSVIEDWENGKTHLDDSILARLAELLDVPDGYFSEPLNSDGGLGQALWVRPVDQWFANSLYPYERQFVAVARRMTRDAEAAQELVHDAYAQILSGEKWRSIVSARAYMMTVLVSLSVDRLRRARIVPFIAWSKANDAALRDMSPDALTILAGKEEYAITLDALNSLPHKCREVVRLRRLEDKSPQQIARQLGISLKTVEGHLTRANLHLARVRQQLDDPGSRPKKKRRPFLGAK